MSEKNGQPLPDVKCPYCLGVAEKFVRDEQKGTYHCSICRTHIPRAFLDPTVDLKVTTGVVGFSGHGKTVYLTSLFSTLKKFSSYWSGYYYRSLDDYTHRIVYEQVPMFERGELPESTPANFPNPALVMYHHMPVFDHALVGYYDTAGEVFSDAAQIERAGFFVAHADVVMFIISIPDCNPVDLDDEMSRLLDTYIRAAMDRLNTDIRKNQKLVVIFTKVDILKERLGSRLSKWLEEGTDSWYAMSVNEKLADLSVGSLMVEEWLREEMDCTRFANMARDHFKEVKYSIVSSLGMEGESGDENSQPKPLRVLDPFLWLMVYAHQKEKQEIKLSLIERMMSWLGAKKKKAIPQLKK